MTTKSYEPLVPLSELGLDRMTAGEIAAYAGMANVTVQLDFLDRPSISLDAAYRIAEVRREAEHAYREAESRRLTEHRGAVDELQRRVNDEFIRARAEFVTEHAGQPFFSQTEASGMAVNHGLTLARLIWAAAPAGVRDQVTSVTYTEAGTITTVPLNLSMPLNLISDYAAAAARKY